jgi:predicted permease
VTIVGVEITLAMVLLVSASMFLQSFRNLLAADGGFDTSRILTARIGAQTEDVSADDMARVAALADFLSVRPGTTHAAAATFMPLRARGALALIVLDDSGDGPEPSFVHIAGVTATFFETLSVPVVRGRGLTAEEARDGAFLAVINETMAGRFWPGRDPVGRRFRLGRSTDPVTVIGVVGDILAWDEGSRPQPSAYLPLRRVPLAEPTLFVRTVDHPGRLVARIREEAHAFDPTWPVLDVRTMREIHHEALSRQRTMVWLFAALGAVALVLGATGVYGVCAAFVAARRREIGLRGALGADRRVIIAGVVRQGLSVAIAGAVAGLAAAWAAASVIRAHLHHVEAPHPGSAAGLVLLLLAVAAAATYLPARRAAAIDPLTAMRE